MKINIGNHTIGSGRTYVIAEIGNNHNGSFARAIEIVEACAAVERVTLV
jgi:sialic acid synthase SpsE